MGTILFQAFVYLCAGVIAVPIAKRLGLGSVLGYLPAAILAEAMVLCMSMVMVIGPTPPGTGVMAAAFSLTASKSTSPTSLKPRLVPGASTRLTPTSTTTAPGLTISAVMQPARPTAAMRMWTRRH